MIISLSGKKRSGKTTLANHLIIKHGFVEVSWAKPLKEIIGKQLFGLTDDQLYGEENIREAVIDDWGMSPRQILQFVGTDLFRKQVDEDFWVKTGVRELKKVEASHNIVISDTRFPNEIEATKELGGYTLQVIRVGTDFKQGDTHPSEVALDDTEFDYVIQACSGQLDLLTEKMDAILSEISGGAFKER